MEQDYYTPIASTAVAEERRVLERRQALINLEQVKKIEQQLIHQGRKYRRINPKTLVLRK